MLLQPLLMTCLLQSTPFELLGVMDVLPPSVGHAVTCDESLLVRISHLLHSDSVRTCVRVSYGLDCG